MDAVNIKSKHIILLLLGLITGIAAVRAEQPRQLYDQANQLYKQQAYDSALAIYTQLIDAGYDRSELYFNAGNACYQLKKSGYAVYYFTKALQKHPGSDYIRHNLHLAQLQASNKIEQLPTLFFVRWWHVMLRLFSANTWLVCSIVLFWILIFFLGWRRLSDDPPRVMRWGWLPAAVLFCFFFLGAVFSRVAATTHNSAIVVAAGQPLKKAPDANSASIDPVQNGAKVEILDSVENWKKIRLTDGTEGWFNAGNMKTL